VVGYHPEDGGSMDLWNDDILPQHYTTSQPGYLNLKHHRRDNLKTRKCKLAQRSFLSLASRPIDRISLPTASGREHCGSEFNDWKLCH